MLLCEKGDLAEGASSHSGKLAHGGLRYLEYHGFRLAREALIEREAEFLRAQEWPQTAAGVLLRRAKHGLHLTSGEAADFRAWMEDQAKLRGASPRVF